MGFGNRITNYRGTCRDCRAQQIVLHSESQAASPPRCTVCGGMLDLGKPKFRPVAKKKGRRKHRRRPAGRKPATVRAVPAGGELTDAVASTAGIEPAAPVKP